MSENLKRILLVRTDRIGDVILSLPLSEAIKRHFPEISVGFLCTEYTAPVVQMCPWVDEILCLGSPELKSKMRNYDAAVLIHPTLSDSLLLWQARIPIRVGSAYRAYSFLFSKRVFEHRRDCRHHELTYNLHLLRPLGIDVDWITPKLFPPGSAIEDAGKIIAEKGLEKNEFVVIHPGSKKSSLSWSAEHFKEFAALLENQGKSFLVTAGRDETELARYVAGGKEELVVHSIDLKILAALFSFAYAVVAPNTGTLHLADAVGTKVFCVYPQLLTMSPLRWGPANHLNGAIMPGTKFCRKCTKKCREYPCPDTFTAEKLFHKIFNVG